jgi:hypothetical protein
LEVPCVRLETQRSSEEKLIAYTNTGDKWSKEKQNCIEYCGFYNISIDWS